MFAPVPIIQEDLQNGDLPQLLSRSLLLTIGMVRAKVKNFESSYSTKDGVLKCLMHVFRESVRG